MRVVVMNASGTNSRKLINFCADLAHNIKTDNNVRVSIERMITTWPSTCTNHAQHKKVETQLCQCNISFVLIKVFADMTVMKITIIHEEKSII